jgi:hypothetical protein
MRWTVVSLVRVVLNASLLAHVGGCIDPHADYDDFKARPFAEPMHDAAAAPDVPLTACQTLLEKDPSGEYFASCLPVVTGTSFGLKIEQKVTNVDAGNPELQISFTPLKITGTNIDDTVGNKTDLPPTPIASDCTYDLQIGDLTIPEEATDLGAEAKAENVSLRGLLETESQACAELDGKVTAPIPLSLNDPGDFCLFQRVMPGATIQQPDKSAYACALPGGDP